MATELQRLYEGDFYAWTAHQAGEPRRLKGLRLDTGLDLDLEHVAEEVDGLGSEVLAGLMSHCTVLV